MRVVLRSLIAVAEPLPLQVGPCCGAGAHKVQVTSARTCQVWGTCSARPALPHVFVVPIWQLLCLLVLLVTVSSSRAGP